MGLKKTKGKKDIIVGRMNYRITMAAVFALDPGKIVEEIFVIYIPFQNPVFIEDERRRKYFQ